MYNHMCMPAMIITLVYPFKLFFHCTKYQPQYKRKITLYTKDKSKSVTTPQINEEEMRRRRPPGFQTKARREEVGTVWTCFKGTRCLGLDELVFEKHL